MKLALVTQDEFNEIWAYLQPQDRMSVGAPIVGVVVQLADTLVLVKPEEVSGAETFAEIQRAYALLLAKRQKRSTFAA